MSLQQDLIRAAKERRIRLYGAAVRPTVRREEIPPPPPLEGYTARETAILTLCAMNCPIRPTTANIIDLVAAVHGVKTSDVLGKRRKKTFVLARAHAIAMILQFRPDMSLVHIGRVLGLDHSTVIHHRNNWPKTLNKLQREVVAFYGQFHDAEPVVG